MTIVAARSFSPVSVRPDWQAFQDCILRRGTPRRVHNVELGLDSEMQQAVADRFDLEEGLDRDDPFFPLRRQIAIQSFLGYDYVVCGLDGMEWMHRWDFVDDTATECTRMTGRRYMNEHQGPIASWEDFERYPWPDPAKAATRSLEWYERNLPDGMCVVAGLTSHYAERLSWLLGYEALCYALYDQRDLVRAIFQRVDAITAAEVQRYLQFDRVRFVWGSDDMGFRTGLLIGPVDTRELVLAGHKRIAALVHEAGRPYFLHSCGNLAEIRRDPVDDVRIDAKHSFEDTIERVTDARLTWGGRVALLGGIDVDFLCRSDEGAIRRRVRQTIDACLPGGGWCLGTGNTVANYIPIDHFLAMVDEGRRYVG
jgi:uroporphyrinogen decarboxylase